MQFRTLGHTGLKISRLVVGGAHIGSGDMDEQRTRRLVEGAHERGVNTFYTANTYSDGRAQELMGRALHRLPRQDVIVILRLGMYFREPLPVRAHVPEDDGELQRAGIWPTNHGLSRKHLTEALHASLDAMNLDYVDVLSVQVGDPMTPIEETLETLDDFVRRGKALYVGCAAGWPAWQVVNSHRVSERRGLTKLRAFQAEYNLFNRWPEREELPACSAVGVGVLAFNSLAGNVLAGRRDVERLKSDAGPGVGRVMHALQYTTDWCLERVGDLVDLGEAVGRSPTELAQGWVLANDRITALQVGPNDPSELDPMVAAVDSPLESTVLDQLEATVAMKPPPVSGLSSHPMWHLV